MDAGGAIRRGGYCRARKQSGPSRVDWSRAPYRTGRDEMRRSPVGEGSFGWSPAPVRAHGMKGEFVSWSLLYFLFLLLTGCDSVVSLRFCHRLFREANRRPVDHMWPIQYVHE
jgi:hypothetical protein